MSVVRAVAVVSLLVTVGCAHAELAYGITEGGIASDLVSFDTANPGLTTFVGQIANVTPGFVERAIDFRPSNGQLYMFATAPGGAYEIYTLDLNTAIATRVGGGVIANYGWTIRVSMDFDPVTDQMRIATLGTRNNFRFNADTGALIAEDARIAYVGSDVNNGSNPIVGDIAYSNNVVGATSTTLYFYDYSLDSLARVGGVGGTPSANTGELHTIGEAVPGDFLTLTAAIGMDISGATGTCYLSHDDVDGVLEQLSTVNLATGVTTLVGNFDVDMLDIALAIAPPIRCDGIDFNGNGVFPEDADVIDFFFVLAGGDCPTGTCNDIDFNNNTVFPEDQDVIDFFNVLAGGEC